MGAPFRYNKSVRVEVRPDKVTGDAGVLLCREVLSASGVDRWLSERIDDARDPRRTRHSLAELVRTACLLAAQCRRDHDDATMLRDDPAFRLAASGRAGTTPLAAGRVLASQPTLSRLAGWRLRARNGGRRLAEMVVAVDSLPIEVHGKQPGSGWNGYCKATVYHPLVASSAETGDLLDARLRAGKAHTAAGGTEFVLAVLDRVERHCCRRAVVRMDAGYPAEQLMRALEDRGTPFVARLRRNAVLDRLAERAVDEAVQETWYDLREAGDDARMWWWEPEQGYRAASWSRSRRVVCVVKERPGELFPEVFWLITSMSADAMPADALLALYRKRGKAEGHMGELKSVVDPACRRLRGPSAGTGADRSASAAQASTPSPATRRACSSRCSATRPCTCCARCWNAPPRPGGACVACSNACCERPPGSPSPDAASSRSSAARRATGRWPPDSSPCCRTRAASAAPAPVAVPASTAAPTHQCVQRAQQRAPNAQNPLASLVSTV